MLSSLRALFLITAPSMLVSQLTDVHFVDIARELGFRSPNVFGERDTKQYILETTGTGVAIIDYNNDGRNDVLFVNGTTLKGDKLSPSVLYQNDGAGKFTDVSAAAGFTRTGWGQGVCAGDYNNDGYLDLLITYYGYNSLFRNNGGAKFVDVTQEAGLPVTGSRWGSGCAFVDYDRDGYLDLFISNYVDLDLATAPKPGDRPECKWKGIDVMCGPRGLPAARNVLYHNERDGTFRDVSEKTGILKPGGRYGLGVLAADFNNDGWQDIYVACDMTPSLLYQNRGNGTFDERGVEAGVAYNFDGQLQAGMGVGTADFDGNGFLDIVKTNFSGDLPSLYQNEDGRFFSDVSREAGLGVNQLLGWGAAFVDVDEDGWPDIVLANGHVYPEIERAKTKETYAQPTLLYRNLGKRKFADVTKTSGAPLQASRVSRGLAVGDLDGDGRPEIVISNMNDVPTVLKNTGRGANFISIELKGKQTIGARVSVEASGHTQMQPVLSGGSFYSQNALALHFGIASAAIASRIEVVWPDGTRQEWKAIPANSRVTLTQGQPKPLLSQFGKS
jgi:enediyne biosynthesis protein E4